MNIYIRQDIYVGIFWNQTDWLITASDWDNIITIADKNIWATTVYNSWDTVSQSNCWYYYQWGNNYWFPVSWPVNTSSSQVNAQNYWPWNYYSSSTYITWQSSNWWDSSNNANLWWWTTDTYEARRWPCSSWYHIPSYTERGNLSTLLFTSLWLTKNWLTLATYLKLPPNWYISSEWWTTPNWMWIYRHYWSSNNVNAWNAFGIYAKNDAANLIYGSSKVQWEWIRPFKNEPVTPTSTRTILYQQN